LINRLHSVDVAGERFGIYNLAEIIETAAAKNETLDWKQAYTELRHQLGCNAKKIELKLQSSAAPEGSEIGWKRSLGFIFLCLNKTVMSNNSAIKFSADRLASGCQSTLR